MGGVMSSIVVSGNTSGAITIAAPAVAGTNTLTLPASTGTVVLDSATQTLTNKTIQGGSITQGTAVASTSGTSINFTSIPSWVKRITVMFNEVSLSSTANFLIQIGAGSTTITGYVSTSNSVGQANNTGGASSTAGFIINQAAAASLYSGTMVLTNITGNTWVSSHTGKVSTTVVNFGGGVLVLGGTLDRVIITSTSTDAFDAGSINILYE